MAAVASRSSLLVALLRNSAPANRESLFQFLQGLSRDELQCIAEFQGSCILESSLATVSPYRVIEDFFDPQISDRWCNAGERAHKIFVVISWLDQLNLSSPRIVRSLNPA